MSNLRKTALAAAWLITAIIVFSTLSPLHLRPRTGHPDLERFGAFFLAGACFALAHPRRRGRVAAGVILAAALLEAAQLLAPGRDAHVHDAVVKAAGGLLGVALEAWAERRTRAPGPA